MSPPNWGEFGGRLGVTANSANSVGALQVLPDSAVDVLPSASFYDANPSLRPNQYEWTQALTNLYLHL